MRTIRINLFAVLLVLTLAFSSLVPISMAADKSVISKKQLKVLLERAKEPADHQKIAEYYKHQAVELTKTAKEHEDLAKVYDKHPEYPSMGSKTPFGQGAAHCHRLAQLYGEQAKEAEALAALHEDMAKAAEQKQP